MLLFAFFLCCDEGPNINEFNYEPEVNVFALLLLNSQQTILRIENTYRATDYVPDDRGVPDAQVTIQSNSQQVIFEHRGGGRYAEKDGTLTLLEGETYHLNVHLPEGRQIFGTCTIPHQPAIEYPQAADMIQAYNILKVSWTTQTLAPRYIVSVRGNIYGFSAEAYSDSLAMTFYPFYLAQPDIYVLKVAALDQNYYEYIRMADDQEPVSLLNGGIGVFGALCYDELVFTAQ